MIASTTVTTKTLAVAALLAAGLGLTACGSNSEDATTTATSSTTVASSTAAPASSDEATPSSSMQSAAPAPETTAQDPLPPVAAPALPEVAIPTDVTIEPVTGGQPASQGDAQAITDLVSAVFPRPEDTIRGYYAWQLDNTCRQALGDEAAIQQVQGQLEQMPDIAIADLLTISPEMAGGDAQTQQMFAAFQGLTAATVDGVNNIMVNGNDASADVTITASGQTQTGPMRFLREDDRWKLCN